MRRPPRSTRPDTPFPYTTLFRSPVRFAPAGRAAVALFRGDVERDTGRGAAVRLHGGDAGTLAHRRAAPGNHGAAVRPDARRSEEHTSDLQSLMRISYDVFCLKKQR